MNRKSAVFVIICSIFCEVLLALQVNSQCRGGVRPMPLQNGLKATEYRGIKLLSLSKFRHRHADFTLFAVDGEDDKSIMEAEIVGANNGEVAGKDDAIIPTEQDKKGGDEGWGETAINLMNVAILGYFLGIVVDILWQTLKARGFRLL